MLEAEHAVNPPQPATQFHPTDAVVGVITRPVTTMRTIAAARPWHWAFGLTIGTALLGGLAGMTAPESNVMPSSGMPPEVLDVLASMRSPGWVLATALIVAPLLLVVGTAILYAIGLLLGGRGTFSGLLSTLAFAEVPSLLQAPISAWLNLGGGIYAFLNVLLGLCAGVWVLVLEVIAVRESLALSTGRAIAVLLLPLAIVVVLAIVVAVAISSWLMTV